MEPRKWTADQLQAEYQEKHPLYTKFCSELVTQLNELIIEAEVTTAFPIQFRVKAWKSIYEKCERNNICPKELGEITDIAGIRIILLFKRDIDKICEIIDQNFEILQKEDTHQRLDTDQFGYGSIHYVLAPPENWLSVPTLRRLHGFRAEVQVRTESQHIWASASHILQYKRESDVPITIRRSINRAAALLETVDLEFERVLNERGGYLEKIKNVEEKETLNTDSLRSLLDKILPEKNKEVDEPYAELLEEIHLLDITTVKELEDLIKRNWEVMSKKEAGMVSSSMEKLENGEKIIGTSRERTLKGVYFNHGGLVRTALSNELGAEFPLKKTIKKK